jgi:CDP-diacylglycerol--glycerol-3-phosphate 3-phosphatidyltransferase
MTMLSANVSASVDRADAAELRMRGTVFENVHAAHGVYRVCLSVGRSIGRVGISANALTYVALGLAALSGVAAAVGWFGVAALFVIASGVFDMLDGAVARASGTVSRWGALLDSTVDRLADGFPLLGITVFYAGSGWFVAVPALAMMGAFTVSYVRARAEALGVVLPPLFMRRAERVILITLSLLVGLVTVPSAPIGAPLLFLGVAVLGILNFVGCVWALKAARHILLSCDRGTASVR